LAIVTRRFTSRATFSLRLQRKKQLFRQALSQFLATAAAEKMSALETLEYILEQANERDTRKGFEKVLRAVPDVEPDNPLDIIKE
jgi:hypothetical protein